MLFLCARCQTRYKVADEKVGGRVVKIRCKHCGALIVLKGSGASGVRTRSPDPGPAVALEGPAAAGPRPAPPAAPPAPVSVAPAPPLAAPVPAPQAPRIATPVAAPVAAAEARIWHVSVGREKRGPLTVAEVKDLVRTGAVNEKSYAWKSGMGAWEHLSAIPTFAQALISRSPAPELSRPVAAPAPAPAPAPVAAPVIEDDADVTIADVSLQSLVRPHLAREEPTALPLAAAHGPAARSEEAGLTEEAPIRFEGDLLDFLSDVEVDPRTGMEVATPTPAPVPAPAAAPVSVPTPPAAPKAAAAPVQPPPQVAPPPPPTPIEPVRPAASDAALLGLLAGADTQSDAEVDDGGEIIELLSSNDLHEEDAPTVRSPAPPNPPPMMRIRASTGPVAGAARDEAIEPAIHIPDDHEERFFLAAEQAPIDERPHIEEELSGPGPAVDESYFPGGQAPIIDLPTVAVRPSRKEVKGMVQEFSLMIRLNKRSNRRAMITWAIALVVIAAAAATVLYIERNRVAEDLGEYADTHEGSVTVMEEVATPVKTASRNDGGRTWRDAQRKTMVEEIDYRELRAESPTQPEITIEVKAPPVEKAPIAVADAGLKAVKVTSEAGTPGGPGEKKLSAAEYEKLMKDDMGKQETRLELPSINGAAKKTVVDDAEVNNALRAHSKDYFRCRKNADPVKVRIVVSVDGTGSVAGTQVELTPGPDPMVESCMRAIVSKLKFAPSVNGGRGSLAFLLQ